MECSPRPELNWCKRFCRPLRNHSVTWPYEAEQYRQSAVEATTLVGAPSTSSDRDVVDPAGVERLAARPRQNGNPLSRRATGRRRLGPRTADAPARIVAELHHVRLFSVLHSSCPRAMLQCKNCTLRS